MVDEQEAPDGYIAVQSTMASCSGCAFEHTDWSDACYELVCQPVFRKDGCDVIFIAKSDE